MPREPDSLTEWLAAGPPPDTAFAQTLATVAERVISGEDFFVAVREFLDEFVLRPPRLRENAIAMEPARTGDARYDAYLAALAEHLATKEGAAVPPWTGDRSLDVFWFPARERGFRALAIVQSPMAFRRRGIFISAGSLQRV